MKTEIKQSRLRNYWRTVLKLGVVVQLLVAVILLWRAIFGDYLESDGLSKSEAIVVLMFALMLSTYIFTPKGKLAWMNKSYSVYPYVKSFLKPLLLIAFVGVAVLYRQEAYQGLTYLKEVWKPTSKYSAEYIHPEINWSMVPSVRAFLRNVKSQEPLSAQKFDRVMTELEEWKGFLYEDSSKHVFTEITRESLTRLLATPQFWTFQKTEILDLALMMGAIELHGPDDILLIDQVFKVGSIIPAKPTTHWSTVGVAFRALLICRPHQDSKMENLKLSDISDVRRFNECVTKETQRLPAPDTDKTQFPDGMPWLENDIYKGNALLLIEDVLVSVLHKQPQCHGDWPNNCIYLSLFLAELAPANHELAIALQQVDSLVKIDQSLNKPDLTGAQIENGINPNELYIISNISRYLFLGAKLTTQMAAPDYWPAHAWLDTNREMAQIETLIRQQSHYRHINGSSFDYVKDGVSWHLDRALLGTTWNSKEQRKILLAQAELTAEKQGCVPPGMDGNKYGILQPAAQKTFNFARLAAGDESTCANSSVSVDYTSASLRKEASKLNTDELVSMQARYDSLIGNSNLGVAHEIALGTYIATNQSRCDSYLLNPMALNTGVYGCNPWVAEPQTVTTTLPNSKLKLTDANKFESINIAIGKKGPTGGNWVVAPTHQSIVDGVVAYAPNARGAFEAELTKIEKMRGLPYAVQLFQNSQLTKWLVVLSVGIKSPVSESANIASSSPLYLTHNDRVVLVIENNQIHPLWIPGRFSYQYDSGNISAVSDLDKDGNFEVWFEGSWGECDGEEAEPGVNCAISTQYMGEVFGNALTWFVRGKAPKINNKLSYLGAKPN